MLAGKNSLLKKIKFRQQSLREQNRVTRLDEFSPLGRLFTLGIFLKITEVGQNFCATFSTVKSMYYF
jgi:hypothetical protein